MRAMYQGLADAKQKQITLEILASLIAANIPFRMTGQILHFYLGLRNKAYRSLNLVCSGRVVMSKA